MQEEVTQKTMALAITTSRMTASILAKAMRKFLEAQKNKSHQLPKGKQTLKELMKHNTGVSMIITVRWSRLSSKVRAIVPVLQSHFDFACLLWTY